MFFLGLFITSSFAAEPQPKRHKPIVIVAKKLPPAPLLSLSVSRVTSSQIAALQYTQLNDLLNSEPGINVTQSGHVGQRSSIFMRGMSSDHIAVRIDGMRVNAPDSPAGSFDFSDLTTDGMESVEVIRGAASSLYGTDAIGGVINLSSQKGGKSPKTIITTELGSVPSERLKASISGEARKMNMALTASVFHTSGLVGTPDYLQVSGGNYPRLPYTLKNIVFRGGSKISEQTEVSLFSRLNEASSHYQNQLDSVPQLRRQILNRVQVDHASNANWVHQFGVGILSVASTNAKDRPSFSSSRGQRIVADWRQKIHLHPHYQLEPIIEVEQEQFHIQYESVFSRAHRQQAGFALLQRWMPMETLTVELAGRQDWSNKFHSPLCYRGGVKWKIPFAKTEFFTNYGTAFKAPTLFQLFGETAYHTGNPDLQPEKARSYEFGIKQPFTHLFNATMIYFHNNLNQLLQYDYTLKRDMNIAKATTKGIESILEFLPTQHTRLELNHTLTLTCDGMTGQALKRFPKHKVFIRGSYVHELVRFFAEWMWVGRRLDVHPVTFKTVTNKSYNKLTLKADYSIYKDWVLYARIENVLDKEIEDPLGYRQARMVGYVGLKTQF